MRTGERSDDRVECIWPQATYRFAARPDFENVRWALGEGLCALRRANHPRGQVGRLHLRIHEPGIIFEAPMIRRVISKDEQRDAGVTPLTLHALALNQAPEAPVGWEGECRRVYPRR